MADLSALEDFIRTNPDARELKRALAVKMTLGQYTHAQIEGLLGVTSGFISKWKHRYLADGVDALQLAHRGSVPFLSTDQRQQLFDWLKPQGRTSVFEVASYIEQHFQVRFKSEQSYYDLLHQARFSWKKSQAQNPKADLDQIEAKRVELKKN
jgi:putative transposase